MVTGLLPLVYSQHRSYIHCQKTVTITDSITTIVINCKAIASSHDQKFSCNCFNKNISQVILGPFNRSQSRTRLTVTISNVHRLVSTRVIVAQFNFIFLLSKPVMITDSIYSQPTLITDLLKTPAMLTGLFLLVTKFTSYISTLKISHDHGLDLLSQPQS